VCRFGITLSPILSSFFGNFWAVWCLRAGIEVVKHDYSPGESADMVSHNDICKPDVLQERQRA
jgi:hypothetical protein